MVAGRRRGKDDRKQNTLAPFHCILCKCHRLLVSLTYDPKNEKYKYDFFILSVILSVFLLTILNSRKIKERLSQFLRKKNNVIFSTYYFFHGQYRIALSKSTFIQTKGLIRVLLNAVTTAKNQRGGDLQPLGMVIYLETGSCRFNPVLVHKSKCSLCERSKIKLSCSTCIVSAASDFLQHRSFM